MVKLPKRFDGGLAATLLGVVVAVYLAVMLGQTVKRNYDLNKEINTLQQQIVLLKQQKEQLSFNLQYYQTDSFAEREARGKLGLQKPGEGVIILPPKTEAARGTLNARAQADKRSNLRQWIDFLLGRSS